LRKGILFFWSIQGQGGDTGVLFEQEMFVSHGFLLFVIGSTDHSVFYHRGHAAKRRLGQYLPLLLQKMKIAAEHKEQIDPCSDAGRRYGRAYIVIEKNVPTPMRDGTILRADVFRPAAPAISGHFAAYPVQ
jgi:hypothetical protein